MGKNSPQVKNVKQLHIPKREKNTLHHQKVVKNFQAKNPQMKTTLVKTLMEKNNINPAQKIVQVGKNLEKNIQMNVQKKKKKKKVMSTVKQKEILQRKKMNKNLHSFIKNVDSNKKDYINLIIVFLNNNKKNVKWNSKGEFYYNDEKVTNSNIGKLIIHVVSDSKSNPIGMTKFYKMLGSLGIPKYLVLNKKGKYIINKYLKKTNSKWRPPGNLNV